MTAAVPNITDHSPDDPEAKIAPTSVIPVSYTHLTLPTKRIV